MADAGRRKKAPSLAVLEGYRKDRINEAAPVADGEIPPTPPKWIAGFDPDQYEQRIAELRAVDTSEMSYKELGAHHGQIESLCVRQRIADTAVTFWQEYAPMVNRLGISASIDTPKFAVAALSVAAVLCGYGKATDIAQARAALSEFAMDPLTRQKFVTGEADDDDPMAKLLKARGL